MLPESQSLPHSGLFVPLGRARSELQKQAAASSMPLAGRGYEAGEELLSLFFANESSATDQTCQAVAIILFSLYSRLRDQMEKIMPGEWASASTSFDQALTEAAQLLRNDHPIEPEAAEQGRSNDWQTATLERIEAFASADGQSSATFMDGVRSLLENASRDPDDLFSDLLCAAVDHMIGTDTSPLVQWLGSPSLKPSGHGKLGRGWLVAGAIILTVAVVGGAWFYFQGSTNKETPGGASSIAQAESQAAAEPVGQATSTSLEAALDLAKAGKFTAARSEMIKLADQGSADANLWLAQDILHQGNQSITQTFDQAWQSLGRGGQPDALSFHNLQATEAKNLSLAKSYLEKSLKIQPSATGLVLLAEVHRREGHPEEAIQILRNSLINFPELNYLLATIYRGMSDEQEATAAAEQARAHFLEAARSEADQPGVWMDLAMTYFFLKEAADGIKTAEEGKERFPDHRGQFDRLLVYHHAERARNY